jgi:type II secretory pathway predicted ATPase ExeA
MLSDVRNYYGLAKDFGQAGYFETEHSEQIVRELKLEIKVGKLVALSGIIGSGKSTMLRSIQEALAQDKEVLVSKSLLVEKGQISLATLIMALFYDLAIETDFKIPTQPERRERALRDLIRKRQRPIALFIDESQPRLSLGNGGRQENKQSRGCSKTLRLTVQSAQALGPRALRCSL